MKRQNKKNINISQVPFDYQLDYQCDKGKVYLRINNERIRELKEKDILMFILDKLNYLSRLYEETE